MWVFFLFFFNQNIPWANQSIEKIKTLMYFSCHRSAWALLLPPLPWSWQPAPGRHTNGSEHKAGRLRRQGQGDGQQRGRTTVLWVAKVWPYLVALRGSWLLKKSGNLAREFCISELNSTNGQPEWDRRLVMQNSPSDSLVKNTHMDLPLSSG